MSSAKIPGWLRAALAFVGLMWVAAFVLCVSVVAKLGSSQKPAPAPVTSARERWRPYAEHDAREEAIARRNSGKNSGNPAADCKLTIPGSGGAVPLFPTEEGLDEFESAAIRGDTAAQMVALRSNGGVIVPSGPRCAYLDHGIARSKVRVLDGDRMGASGWTPTEWTRGQ